MGWLSLNEAVATDWTDLDPRHRPRSSPERVAESECRLVTSQHRRCDERYFRSEDLEEHQATVFHHSQRPAEDGEWTVNVLSGRRMRVRHLAGGRAARLQEQPGPARHKGGWEPGERQHGPSVSSVALDLEEQEPGHDRGSGNQPVPSASHGADPTGGTH